MKTKSINRLSQKFWKYLLQQKIVLTARIRMRLGIKAAKEIHKLLSAKYAKQDKDSKRICQYIVLLDRPVLKRKNHKLKWVGRKLKITYNKYIKIEERLFWVNRQNFKKIRNEGWLPKNMHLDELKKKAFYVSSMKRTYEEEFKAVEAAMNKYIKYVKVTNKIPL